MLKNGIHVYLRLWLLLLTVTRDLCIIYWIWVSKIGIQVLVNNHEVKHFLLFKLRSRFFVCFMIIIENSFKTLQHLSLNILSVHLFSLIYLFDLLGLVVQRLVALPGYYKISASLLYIFLTLWWNPLVIVMIYAQNLILIFLNLIWLFTIWFLQ